MQERVHEVIAGHATTRPDALAIASRGRWTTYGELRELVLATARTLATTVRRAQELPVVVVTDRSEWAVVAMLGIWQANCLYVPLAEDTPQQRLRDILTSVRPGAILTDKKNADHLRSAWGDCPVVEIEQAAEPGGPDVPIVAPHDPSGAQLACLVHTSGSSGPAKGVMIDHRALSNLMTAVSLPYAPDAADRALHFGAFGWDSSIEEVILPLYKGASLVMRTDEADFGVPHFLQELQNQSVSHLYLPTSYWHEICLELSRSTVPFPPSVRSVLIGGEGASAADLATWRGAVPAEVELWNCYGLTETCVTSTIYRDDRGVPAEQFRGMPLGGACPSVSTAILDDDMQPVPTGEIGELYIGGPGVARGYWRDPVGTAASFIPAVGGKGRHYRTGDLAREDASGLLHYEGRVDRQAKINGFRVNPNEVEGVLAAHPQVRRACVIPRRESTGLTGIVAFLELVTDDGDIQQIKDHLTARLPGFMVPTTVEVLQEMPLLPNGKIDVSSLTSRASAAAGTPAGVPELRQEHLREHHRDDEVKAVWCEALGIAESEPEDDFLELGGNSLSGMRIAARLNEAFDVDIRFRDILEGRTLAGLVARVTELRARAQTS
ncbi:non-ribosomal peptide synthetase [Streptomyces sp. CS131]|uniref:non-ribosomal peptide synthetase n=1 Tax=Streptomyces sp. CS131 TaxID=2162711 RepID=UPI000D521712|nr:non-ribosomal peptide synthetase [Streptomyces sp. CS131]PVC90282.1 hypothetical protein DBP20_04165 [Streptomyces sp. CS131]